MSKYRKKPVVIDAVLWNGEEIVGGCPEWMQKALYLKTGELGSIIRMGNKLDIYTLEGVMSASAGDWVIKGVIGELYPCKPAVFKQTYEEVEDSK